MLRQNVPTSAFESHRIAVRQGNEEIEVHSYSTILLRTESVRRPDFFSLTEKTIDFWKHFICRQQRLTSRISEAQEDALLRELLSNGRGILDFTNRLLEADDNRFPKWFPLLIP